MITEDTQTVCVFYGQFYELSEYVTIFCNNQLSINNKYNNKQNFSFITYTKKKYKNIHYI